MRTHVATPVASCRDKDGNGTLDKQEVKEALLAFGFTFIDDKQINTIFKRADSDKNGACPVDQTRNHSEAVLRICCSTGRERDPLGHSDPLRVRSRTCAEVIDFEEFVKETPKTLRTSLVKLAKQNGHDLGFLA